MPLEETENAPTSFIRQSISDILSKQSPLNLQELTKEINDAIVHDSVNQWNRVDRKRVLRIAKKMHDENMIEARRDKRGERHVWSFSHKEYTKPIIQIDELHHGTHFEPVIYQEPRETSLPPPSGPPWKGWLRIVNISDIKFWNIHFEVTDQKNNLLCSQDEKEMIAGDIVEYPIESRKSIPESIQVDIIYYDGYNERLSNNTIHFDNFYIRQSNHKQ